MRFATLHNHSVFSLKDAIAEPIDYVKRIHEYNKSQTEHEIVGLAITEHGCFYSATHHCLACTNPLKGDEENRTIKPIYGNEIYHVDDISKLEEYTSKDRHHLVLLAKDDEGLKNLIKITTHAGLNKYKPKKSTKDFQIADEEYVKQHGKGIIALSACIGGKLAKLILNGDYDGAKNWAIEMSKCFEEFYLEIQPHDTLPEQLIVNDALLKIHEETGIELVITSDSHYVYKEDKKYHDLMKQIDYLSPFTVEAHMWTPDELIDWCNKHNVPLSAIENTAKIADSCTADIRPKDKRGLMPDFPCPDGYNPNSYLIKIASEKMMERFKTNKYIKDINEYLTRLYYELDIITQSGFSSYFLILWDWFEFCRKNKIYLGPGRGSAAGSLVAYCLGITNKDPIKNGLIFER